MKKKFKVRHANSMRYKRRHGLLKQVELPKPPQECRNLKERMLKLDAARKCYKCRKFIPASEKIFSEMTDGLCHACSSFEAMFNTIMRRTELPENVLNRMLGGSISSLAKIAYQMDHLDED